MMLANKKWTEEEMFEKRKEVLSWWPTGKDVDLDEAIEYQKRLPEHKVFAKKLNKCKKEGIVPIQLGLGHATVEETAEHAKLVEAGGVDMIWVQPDTYTRRREFQKVQQGIEESNRTGKSVLNGYPYVNHGVKNMRRLTGSMNVPVMLTAGSDEEPMLSQEIGFAGGANANLYQDLRQLLSHSKNYPLERRIQNNQYNARIAAYYEEHGAPIECLIVGCIHGYTPSGIASALALLQCLLIAEQGVKHISIMSASLYNLVYDTANITICRKLANEYLERHGYHDVRVFIVPWPWEGNWPPDADRGAAVIGWQSAISLLGGADWIHLRSVHEGIGIPNPEANVTSVKIGRQMRQMLAGQKLADSKELQLETQMLELEVRAIVDKVLEMGDGDPAIGEVNAVKAGILDFAITPWAHCRGEVLPFRDANGVFRYANHGNIPLPKEVAEYHKDKLREREKAEGKKVNIEMAIRDFHALSS